MQNYAPGRPYATHHPSHDMDDAGGTREPRCRNCGNTAARERIMAECFGVPTLDLHMRTVPSDRSCFYCGRLLSSLDGTWIHAAGSVYCDASATTRAFPR